MSCQDLLEKNSGKGTGGVQTPVATHQRGAETTVHPLNPRYLMLQSLMTFFLIGSTITNNYNY